MRERERMIILIFIYFQSFLESQLPFLSHLVRKIICPHTNFCLRILVWQRECLFIYITYKFNIMFSNIISDNVLKEPYFFFKKKEQYQSTHHCFCLIIQTLTEILCCKSKPYTTMNTEQEKFTRGPLHIKSFVQCFIST